MSPIRMSKLESGMRVVLEFNEAFNRRDFAEMMQLLSDDCVFDETFPAPDGTVITGKEAIGELLQNFMREVTEGSYRSRRNFWNGIPLCDALEI